MDAKQLEQCRRYLRNNSLPLLFGPLQLSLVEKLAQDGSPEAVRLLAETVINTRNERVRQATLNCLNSLSSQAAIDQICRVWFASRHNLLAELMVSHGWVAYSWTTPPEISWNRDGRALNPEVILFQVRVWSALKTGRLELLVDQGPASLPFLLKACQDQDQEVASRARTVLLQLNEPATQEALCRMVLEQDNPLVREIVLVANYVPRQPTERALFFFLTEQWERYESLDFDLRFLRPAYERASEPVRRRLIELARQSGRIELLKLVSKGRDGSQFGRMSYQEWELTLDLLVQEQRWPELWELTRKAPPRWTIHILQALAKTNWLPELAQEQKAFETLKNLAQNCNPAQLPAGKLLTSNRQLKSHIEPSNIYLSPDGQRLVRLSSGGIVTTSVLEILPVPKSETFTIPATGPVEFSYSLKPGLELAFNIGQDSRKHLHSLDLVAFSPDGQTVELVERWQIDEVDRESVIHLLNLATGTLNTLPVLKTDVWTNHLSFSRKGPVLISDPGVFYLWEENNWRKLELALPERVQFDSFAVSPTGQLVTGKTRYDAEGIWLWQLSDGKFVNYLKFSEFRLNTVAFSPDGEILVTALRPKTFDPSSKGLTHPIWLWNLASGKVILKLEGHKGLVNRLVFSQDGGLLASLSNDRIIKIWNLATGKLITRKVAPNHRIRELVFRADGQTIMSLESLSHELFINNWASRLTNLARLPLEQLTPNDFSWVQKKLGRDSKLSEPERHWLKFIEGLIVQHWRYEIQLEESAKIHLSELDIELEDG